MQCAASPFPLGGPLQYFTPVLWTFLLLMFSSMLLFLPLFSNPFSSTTLLLTPPGTPPFLPFSELYYGMALFSTFLLKLSSIFPWIHPLWRLKKKRNLYLIISCIVIMEKNTLIMLRSLLSTKIMTYQWKVNHTVFKGIITAKKLLDHLPGERVR